MHDVVIVGGGVAGCYLASQLPKDLDVVIIERNKKVIPKDSGIVSTRIEEFIGKDVQHLIEHKINKMECISPSGMKFSLQNEQPFAYILKREKFGVYLRKRAGEKCTFVNDGVTSVEFHKDHAAVKTTSQLYNTRMVVGCDGSNSVVRKHMNINNPMCALGMMVKTNQKLEGEISVFFNKYFSPDFFAWIIPQGNEYGLMTSIRPKAYLDYFIKNMYLPQGKLYAYTIPYTYTKSYGNRAMLIGDACGQNKPLTGGGIIFSMVAANYAAQIISDAFEINRFDSNFFSYYEKYWKKDLAWEIEKQFLLRMIYRKLTNNEVDEIFKNFGPLLSTLNGFDYDKLSGMWKDLPKLKLIKFLISKLPRLL